MTFHPTFAPRYVTHSTLSKSASRRKDLLTTPAIAATKNTWYPGNCNPAQPLADAVLAAGFPGTNPTQASPSFLWNIKGGRQAKAAAHPPNRNRADYGFRPDLEIAPCSDLDTRLEPPGSVAALLPLPGAAPACGWSQRLWRRLKPAQPCGNVDTVRCGCPGQLPAERVFCEGGRR